MSFKVASVPYVNAVPLVAMFELMPSSPVTVVYDVPSNLPARLDSGEVQAILVSSVDALRNRDRKMAEGVCIGSMNKVRSVRLFSKVPFADIRNLALDASSMTSNRLAQIILAEKYGVSPMAELRDSHLAAMLNSADAAVLIGDKGLEADGTGLNVLDLGEAWQELTGLPFMWAGWVGNSALTPSLVEHLQAAFRFAQANESVIFDFAQARSGWTRETVASYLRETMTFKLDQPMLEGLSEFASKLRVHELEEFAVLPPFVGAEPALSA